MMLDPLTWWTQHLPLPRRREKKIPGGTVSYVPGIESRYDTDMPWIVWHFGRTPDTWWPPWRSTRVLGRAAVELECAVCGKRKVVAAKMPRFGDPNPTGREHPERVRFKLDHLHRDKSHPMAWAKPLLNTVAHGRRIDLDLLAMRLEADLRESQGMKS